MARVPGTPFVLRAAAGFGGEAMRMFGPTVMAVPAGPQMPAPGTVMGLGRPGLLVACAGKTAVGFAELQLPGRKRLPAAAVLAGRPIPEGTSLQDPSARPRE